MAKQDGKTLWVDGPFALIEPSKSGDKLEERAQGARRMAAEMSIVHNCLIRGINAVYLQCVNVGNRGSAKDKEDFASFAYAWGRMVHEHHAVEENKIFPGINEVTGVEGLMDANVNEHSLFLAGLSAYEEYVERVRTGKEELDGERLRAVIDTFMPTLREHLENEITTLVEVDSHADKCDWGVWFQTTAKEIAADGMKRSSYRTEVLPMAFCLHDKTYESGIWGDFPPTPWAFTFVLRWLFMKTHKDWWRFAPCDLASQPWELPFA